VKGLPGTRQGRTWTAQAAEGGGLIGAGRGHGVFDFFIYPLSRLRLFLRLLTPAGSEWVHEAFLGSIWGTLVVLGQIAGLIGFFF
jgi:hypothetical protein